MTSPVLKALVAAELEEAEQHARSISAAVARQIGPPPDPGQGNLPAEFATFCQQNGVASLPARPASVALFVLENKHLGIAYLARMVVEISRCHLRRGQADPTSGYPVSSALNHLAKIEAPLSWPKSLRPLFSELTYAVQEYLSVRDKDATRAIKRSQQEAADARKALAALQQPTKEKTDGAENAAA